MGISECLTDMRAILSVDPLLDQKTYVGQLGKANPADPYSATSVVQTAVAPDTTPAAYRCSGGYLFLVSAIESYLPYSVS